MSNKSNHELDMVHGSIFPKIFVYSVPLALSGILQLLFNAADVIVLGRFVGSNELAAVGSTGSLIALLVNFFIGLSVGVNVAVSSGYSAGKTEEVSRVVHTSVTLSLLSGIFLLIVGELVARPMLVFMGSPEEILPLSLTYVRIYFAAVPFILVYNFGAAILRSIGDTRRPFYFLFAAGVINLILNLIFVLVFHMGVTGVALATDISNAVSAILVVITLVREKSCLKLDFRRLTLDRSALKRITSIGLPAGIQSVFFNISNVLIQSSVNSLGATVMAGNAAAISVEGFYNTAYSSITSAAITFTSANVGAGKYSRLDRVRRCSLLASVCICGAFSVIYLLFGRYFLKLYTTEKEVVEWGMVRLTIFACTYFLGSFMDIMSAILRGLGKSILPMFVSLGGAVGFRLFWIYAVFAQHPSYTVLLIGYPISWFLTFLIHFLVLMHVRKTLPGEDLPERKDP